MVDAEGSEDVNDFLQRIRELGDKRDKEDEERTRKLEEEILQGRKERQARRAERTRSISPTKESPSNVSTPSSVHARRDSPQLSRGSLALRETSPEHLSPPNLKGNMASKDEGGAGYIHDKRKGGHQPSGGAGRSTEKTTASSPQPSSSSSSLGRAGTLSWQQRPTSRGSTGARSRPLSVVAAENSRLKSPRGTPDPESSPDTDMSRTPIAQSLGSKDPSWFKQTQDRGLGSTALRKNQEEDKPESWTGPGNLRLPGMSRESTVEPEKESSPRPESVPPSLSREGSIRGSSSWSQRYASTAGSSATGSAMPTTSSRKLEPPAPRGVLGTSTDESGSREPPLHIGQSGRASPTRFDRPTSPTKGLGGFVQSAMLKRSDSQNKRWSAQAGGLSRGNSVASNRSGYDGSRTVGRGTSPPRELVRSGLTRDSSPDNTTRPVSSHNQVESAISAAGVKPAILASARERSTRDGDGFIKPELPEHARAGSKGVGNAPSPPLDYTDMSPPPSPTKSSDTKRWSPQKASWLESALNRPDSPKPTLSTPTQPSWMVDLGKAKSQRSSAEQNKTPGFKEVTTGGLLRSPPMGAGFKKPNISDVASRPSRLTENSTLTSRNLVHTTSLPNTAKSEDLLPDDAKVGSPAGDDETSMEKLRPTKSEAIRPSDTMPQKPTKPSSLESKLSPPSSKAKPITPPKKDFRANLKQRQDQNPAKDNQEAEFRDVFGKLKRAETKNYKAPDELKDNILRGKAGLAATGGPKKTERRDDFKESIVKKKEEMKTGAGVTADRKTSAPEQPETPEALARVKSLSKSHNKTGEKLSGIESNPKAAEVSQAEEPQSSAPHVSVAQQVPSKVPSVPQAETTLNRKLAGRFNPALAGLLSRGPPPASGGGGPRTASLVSGNDGNRTVSGMTAADTETPSNSGQLTHMTKDRARGPKRKAPKTTAQSVSLEKTEQEPQIAERKSPVSSPNAVASVKGVFEQQAPLRSQPISKPQSNIADNRKAQSPSTVATESDIVSTKPVINPKPNPSTPLAWHQTQEPAKSSPDPQVSRASAPKSPEVRKPSSQIAHVPTPLLDHKPRNVGNEKESAPKPLKQDDTIKSNVKYREKLTPAPTSPTKEIATVSVSNAAARWSSNMAKSPQQSQAPKSPIKLPTRTDEEAAYKDACLSDRQLNEPIGLGIRPLPKPPVKAATSQESLNLPSPAIRKVSPPTPTKKPDLMNEKVNANGTSISSQVSRSPLKTSSSNAASLLGKYFGELPPATTPIDIDTPKILESRHQSDANKIKTLRKQIWQVTPDGRKTSLAPQQEHILYEDSMYLCTHVFGSTNGTRTTEVYLWYGDDVSSAAVEDAQLFSRKAAKENGSKLILLHQGKETSEFFQALGGIVITRKNRSGSFVLCGRRHVGQIAFDEAPFSSASLCSGFPYIVSAADGKLYLWKGAGSGADELGCARLIGMDLGPTVEIEEIDEGKEPRAFWEAFPEKKAFAVSAKSSGDWRKKPSLEKHATRLFSVEMETRPTSSGIGAFAMWGRRSSTPGPSPEPGVANIREIHPYAQVDLEGEAVFVLDTFFEIFIILPQTTSNSKPSPKIQNFRTALFFAQEYGILAVSEDDRPFIPKGTVVFTGAPDAMRTAFRKWNAGPSKNRDLVTIPLSEALDAVKE